jgi:hypothetical protein
MIHDLREVGPVDWTLERGLRVGVWGESRDWHGAASRTKDAAQTDAVEDRSTTLRLAFS